MAENKVIDSLPEDFSSFVAEGRMERARQYLEEGRRFKSVSDTDLRSQWIGAFKKLAQKPDLESRELVVEIEAEMEIRKIDPPHDEVRAEVEAFIAYVQRGMKHLRTEDLLADINIVKAKRDGSAKN